MKERPILFSGAMVRAILDGRKTQTRRVVKPQPVDDTEGSGHFFWSKQVFDSHRWPDDFVAISPYRVGDRLWAKETFSIAGNGYFYRADVKQPETVKYSWKPSIFMPRKASRLTLEIVSVGVERLHQITPEDVLAEGIHWRKWLHKDDAPAHTYGVLWDSINGKKYPWSSNPWVWKIKFKKL